MKKRVPVIIIPLVSLLINAADGVAASWYVDNAVSAPGNGKSWKTAYSRFSDIKWENVQAGDFIYISGGPSGGTKTYTESWSVGASGTAGNPITIAVDAANAGHDGTAVFDYDAHGDTATVDAITINNRRYITINGNVNGQNHIAIKNLRNIESNPHGVGEGSNHANCITGRGNTVIIIDHIDFINCNNPVRLGGGSPGNEIMHSNFMQVRGDTAILLEAGANTWDANKIHDNYIELLQNSASPPGEVKAHYGGPDGIQTSSGMSIYNNTFRYTTTTVYTSTQHPDILQVQGNYIKIYNNEFINIADAGIDYDCYANSTPHDVWIYNNLFRIVELIDTYPEYFRFYLSMDRPFISITNFKILNNTFVDNTGANHTGYTAVRFNGFRKSNPTGSGNEIKNNIFYNCGSGSQYPNILIAASAGFTDASFSFDANIYYNNTKVPYIHYNGTLYPVAEWIPAREPHGKTETPSFVSYFLNDANNDLHLTPTDKVAKHAGISLNNYFNEDKDGKPRPQGSAWSIGAYEQ
jgi:hypothetical protein